MKKFDYIIGSIVLVFALVLTFINLNNRYSIDNVKIEVRYQDDVFYIVDIKDDGLYSIKCENSELTLSKNDIILATKKIGSVDFLNEFEIKDGKVKMVNASCSGKDCEKMFITNKHVLPIICTNGIALNPVGTSQVDEIV